MMAHIVVYTVAVATALAVAGFCCERIVVLRRLSRRFVWSVALAASIGFPLIAILAAPREKSGPVLPAVSAVASGWVSASGTTATPVVGERPIEQGTISAPVGTTVPPGSGPRKTGWTLPVPSDRSLLRAWAAISGALWIYLLGVSILLYLRARAWRRESVLGQPVLVSESTGPALLGAIVPRIVVPHWFLDEPVATQTLILEHERQHLAARDPLLLRAGVLAVALVPWNLPLWWQLRRLRLAIEFDCDLRVIRTGAEPAPYGEVLLTVAQRTLGVPFGAVAMSEPVSALEQRIGHLVPAPVRRAALRIAGAAAFAAASVGVAIALEAPALPEQHPAAAALPPLAMPGFPEGGMFEVMMQRLHAAIERYPEIASGTARDGVYIVLLVLDADGGVVRSDMRFASTGQQYMVAGQLQESLPDEGGGGGDNMSWLKGTMLPGGGRLGSSVTLLTVARPRDYDASRSPQRVRDAVRQKHADLELSPRTGFQNVLTVFMTDDGRIDREHVERVPVQNFRNAVPEKAGPEQFRVLGLAPEQLGRMGMTSISRRVGDTAPVSQQMGDRIVQMPGGERESLIVFFAWPPRAGELAGEAQPPVSTAVQGSNGGNPALLPFSRISAELNAQAPSFIDGYRRISEQAVHALVGKYPEILDGPHRDGWYSAAIVLRPNGSVYRSGLRFAADEMQANRDAMELASITSIDGGRSVGDSKMKGEVVDGKTLQNNFRFNFAVLPEGFDEARSVEDVREAVLAKHADLLLPLNAELVNRVTVLMTEDGRIAREKVEFGRRDDLMRGGRPEDFDFTALGVGADQVGVYGITVATRMTEPPALVPPGASPEEMRNAAIRAVNSNRALIVRYVWPRRPGEPVGGMVHPVVLGEPERSISQARQQQNATERALAGRFFPEVIAAPERFASVRPWILLSHQGAVLRTGQVALDSDRPFLANADIGSQMPGVRFGEVESLFLPVTSGQPANVVFVWLAADSPLPGP